MLFNPYSPLELLVMITEILCLNADINLCHSVIFISASAICFYLFEYYFCYLENNEDMTFTVMIL